MKLFKIIGLILVLSPLGQAFGIDQIILDRLHENDPSLEVLDLSSNHIGDAGATAIADALKENTSLTILNLCGNQIRPEGAVALAEALRTNTRLTELYLGSNHIGPEGAVALADALITNTSLTTFNLGANHIGAEGAQALAEALRTNTSLEVLYLSFNQIGDTGARALADALKTNTSLTRLDLYENQIRDAGGRALADALRTNTRLTNLSFGGGGDQMRKALRKKIQRLMSPEGIQEKRRALVPWSRLRHLQLASWNPHVAPVVTTILLLEVRSKTQALFVTDAQGRTVRLPYLPTEMWREILEYLRCGDFGPRALPAP